MEKIGAVAVIGGGIAGVQAATDLAEAGYKVYIIESSSSIGGVMAQLDKTFPTNDCSMCILSPKLVQAGRHSNISIITLAQVQKLEGNPGNFNLTLLKKARYINEDKCNGCGICGQECPVEAIDFFNEGLSLKNAASVSFPQAVPLLFSINREMCIGCGICEAVCKAHAINYTDTDEELKLDVGAIILAIGFDEFEPESYSWYGYKRFPNVITSIEFERILSASGPYTGHVLRPSDGEIPEKIAFLQCVGSRDCMHGKSYCSAVCCMYTAKEAVIAKEHQHEVNPTIFTMDIRAVGKDFDKYIDRAQNEYGIRFIRSRIAAVEEDSNSHNLSLTYETNTGEICTEEFHMVVLAVGLNPPKSAQEISQALGFKLNKYGFCETLPFSLEETTKPGIFVCGAFAAPKDIPESVVQASAAAGNVNLLLSSVKGSLITKKVYPEEIKVEGTSPRIGVFICHCGINIAGVVDVPAVLDFAEDLPNVVYAERNLYTCSADTQTKIKEKIQEHNLNRVVIASCTPRTHEPLFQETLREAGLNPYLYQMTNIRDQCSWVHIKEPKAATEKAKDLVEMAIKRVSYHEPLQELALKITPKALIIGGGVSGMTAALNLAQQGYQTYLIEQENQLGGFSNQLIMTLEGENIQEHLSSLKTAIQNEPLIEIFTDTSILEVAGYLGNFKTKIIGKSSQKKTVLEHGIIITATGAKEYIPTEFSYGTDSRVITQREMEKLLHTTKKAKNLKIIAMVQCVGSRNDARPYCSRICCADAIKNALEVKKQSPSTEVFIFYRDIRTYAFKEEYYRKAREQGVIFIQFDKDYPPETNSAQTGETSLNIKVKKMDGDIIQLDIDLIVLSVGIVAPSDAEFISHLLKIPLNEDNFLLEAHVKLRPVDFATEGIFLCGTARGPANIEESISQAKAAAARSVTILSKEIVMAGAVTSQVREDKCTGCNICIRLCPYNAIEKDDVGCARVIEVLCKGCGVCAASCPEKAIFVRHFTKEQIISEIEAFGGYSLEI